MDAYNFSANIMSQYFKHIRKIKLSLTIKLDKTFFCFNYKAIENLSK